MNAAGNAPDTRSTPATLPRETGGVPSDELLERIAAALYLRVQAQRRAEERLASFAFHERPMVDSGATPGVESGIDWVYFVTRALRLVGDPAVLRLLEALRDGGLALEALAGPTASGPTASGTSASGTTDRVALSDQLGGLATAGLVVRELESNRVSLAPLGEALLDLVADVVRRTDARAP